MKFVIVFIALFAVVLAVPVPPPQGHSYAEIVRLESDVRPDGYQYIYATSDGQTAEATGYLENIGTDDEALAVKGSFQYPGPDGILYQVSYLADKNGFQPHGAHFPVPPQA